jgi:hypothetical protein
MGSRCHFFIELFSIREHEILEISTSRIGCLTEDDHSLSLVCEIWLYCITSHVRIDSHGICFISLESFSCILFGRTPDISSLGIEDDRKLWIVHMDIVYHFYEV